MFNKNEFREFTKVDEADCVLNEYFKNWIENYREGYSNCTAPEYKSFDKTVSPGPISKYTGSLANLFIEYYNNGKKLDDTSEKYRVDLVQEIESAPAIDFGIVLYSLMPLEILRNLKKTGDVLYIPSFISTSIHKSISIKLGNDKNSIDFYSNHEGLVKIYLPKNTNGIYVRNLSRRKDEYEFLIGPYNKLILIEDRPKHKEKESNKYLFECLLEKVY